MKGLIEVTSKRFTFRRNLFPNQLTTQTTEVEGSSEAPTDVVPSPALTGPLSDTPTVPHTDAAQPTGPSTDRPAATPTEVSGETELSRRISEEIRATPEHRAMQRDTVEGIRAEIEASPEHQAMLREIEQSVDRYVDAQQASPPPGSLVPRQFTNRNRVWGRQSFHDLWEDFETHH